MNTDCVIYTFIYSFLVNIIVYIYIYIYRLCVYLFPPSTFGSSSSSWNVNSINAWQSANNTLTINPRGVQKFMLTMLYSFFVGGGGFVYKFLWEYFVTSDKSIHGHIIDPSIIWFQKLIKTLSVALKNLLQMSFCTRLLLYKFFRYFFCDFISQPTKSMESSEFGDKQYGQISFVHPGPWAVTQTLPIFPHKFLISFLFRVQDKSS